MRHTLLTVCLLVLGVVPVTFSVLFDFNRHVLTNYSVKKGVTPSEIYIPQQVVTNPSISDIEVLLLGGSSVREFFPGNTTIDTVLGKICGRPIHALNAGTSSQNLADSAAVVDALLWENAHPKVLIVGLTNYRLSHDWENWSQVLEGQILALPASETLLLQLGFFDAWGWRIRDRFEQIARLAPFLKRARRRPASEIGAQEDRHFYDREPMSITGKLEQTAVSYALRNAKFVAYAERNARRFAQTFAPFAEIGIDVVFLFTTQSPVTRVPEINNESINMAVKLQLESTGVVIDLRNHSKLTEDMFYDEQHLRPSGRAHLWDGSILPAQLRQRICRTS